MRGTIRQKPAPLIELSDAELQSISGGNSIATTIANNGSTIQASASGTDAFVSVVVASGTSNVSVSVGPPPDLASISFAGTQFTDFLPDFCGE